jgi:alcohol dehydrogenase (quinone), cytochrome c subunit
MNAKTIVAVFILLFAASSLAVAQQSLKTSTPPVEARSAQTTAPLSKGEYLARAGDCIACHSVPGGKAFAGGLKMGTPLGAIYSTNITPDPGTGIGTYSFEDFDRAVRAGIAKDGHRLYPAMPYPSYAKITDDDLRALYGFFMKEVPPVKQKNKPSEITGVKSMRWPLALWAWLFVDKSTYAAQPNHDAQWNRGAYLVEGLAHCGACHTPRGWAFQEKALDSSSAIYLQGAELDAWSAPSLRGELRTGLGGWSQSELAAFLKTGHNAASVAFGSMLDVINNSTPYLNDDDVNAMANYLKSLPASTQQGAFVYANATTEALERGKAQEPGAQIYLGYCISCHGIDGKGQAAYMPPLAGNPVVLDGDPSSLINLVLNGATPLVVKGTPDPYRMPQYRVQLTDDEIASVLSFVRAGWGNNAAPVMADRVKALRPVTDPSSDRVIILKMR